MLNDLTTTTPGDAERTQREHIFKLAGGEGMIGGSKEDPDWLLNEVYELVEEDPGEQSEGGKTKHGEQDV